MAKVVDITEKLSFDENPKLRIRGEELEINADAATVLKILDIMGDGQPGVRDTIKCMSLLMDQRSREKLDAMKLSFADYMAVINKAMNLAAGTPEEDDKGETPTRTMT